MLDKEESKNITESHGSMSFSDGIAVFTQGGQSYFGGCHENSEEILTNGHVHTLQCGSVDILEKSRVLFVVEFH